MEVPEDGEPTPAHGPGHKIREAAAEHTALVSAAQITRILHPPPPSSRRANLLPVKYKIMRLNEENSIHCYIT